MPSLAHPYEPSSSTTYSIEDILSNNSYFEANYVECLNSHLRVEFGIDLNGEKPLFNQPSYNIDPNHVFFSIEKDGSITHVPAEDVKSGKLLQGIDEGKTYMLPSVTSDGTLDFSKPFIIKGIKHTEKAVASNPYRPKEVTSKMEDVEYLFIVKPSDVTEIQKMIPSLKKPTFWQKFSDSILKLFGSRNEACKNYEESLTLATNLSNDLHAGHRAVINADSNALKKQIQDSEKQIVKEEAPAVVRQSQKMRNRNMSAAEFEKMLNLMVEEGNIDLNNQAVTEEQVIAKALYAPTLNLLNQAKAAPDRDAFLMENKDSFFALINGLETYVKENLDLKNPPEDKDLNRFAEDALGHHQEKIKEEISSRKNKEKENSIAIKEPAKVNITKNTLVK